jgi:predicted Zn-dependent peptidase
MMFKGTKKLGTTDWKKDAEYNAAIEDLMAEIRGLKLKGLDALRRGEPMSDDATKAATNIARADEARWKELVEKFETLKVAQQGITLGEHISKLFDSNGGTSSNASTSYDRTNYFVELPANKVELYMWLESETFLNPVWREFYTEREAVKEERRLRTEATPTGLINEQFSALFWKAHPYSWPVIGWIVRRAGVIPVKPGKGGVAYREALERLKRGEAIGIFPEGKLTTDGSIARFHKGAARLHLESGRPSCLL